MFSLPQYQPQTKEERFAKIAKISAQRYLIKPEHPMTTVYMGHLDITRRVDAGYNLDKSPAQNNIELNDFQKN